MSNDEKGIYATCDISIVPMKDCDGLWMLYESKRKTGSEYKKNIRLKRIGYDKKGFPVLGKAGEKYPH